MSLQEAHRTDEEMIPLFGLLCRQKLCSCSSYCSSTRSLVTKICTMVPQITVLYDLSCSVSVGPSRQRPISDLPSPWRDQSYMHATFFSAHAECHAH